MKVKVAQSCPTLWDSMNYTVHGVLQARILEWITVPSPGDLPNPGMEPRCPTLQGNSLPAEPQGMPNNTSMGSLSLLQQVFPSQELNQGLLHCRLILYQLSYQGSPDNVITLERKSEVAQSCPALCDPMDCSLSGSSVYGIFQARVLEWIAYS